MSKYHDMASNSESYILFLYNEIVMMVHEIIVYVIERAAFPVARWIC
jgi:hypothetical protein